MKNLIVKALLIGPIVGLFLCPAHAQKTKAQLSTEITTTFPDNTVGSITAFGVRTYETDLLNSIMPTAPVVSGNLACFSGTTGLLQDCGSAPTTVPLTVGTTPVNGGSTTNVIFNNAGKIGEYTVSGSGSVCMSVSCVMTTPNLDTPSSITLTNATGLPVSTGVSGLGTGVATALGINVGSAGAFTTFNGAHGTPSSLTATNVTGTASGLTAGTVTTNANLTGPVTSTGNATAIANNQITRAMEAQGVARSVVGVAGNATANVADIQGSAGQVLAVNAAGTSLAFVGPGQTPGEASTGSATAGNVGEYVIGTVLKASAVSATTATAANLTSVSLTAGDWDVSCAIYYLPAATTNFTFLDAGISTTTAAFDLVTPLAFNAQRISGGSVPGNNETPMFVGPVRASLSGTTTYFCVLDAGFTVSTMTAYGSIRARRVR